MVMGGASAVVSICSLHGRSATQPVESLREKHEKLCIYLLINYARLRTISLVYDAHMNIMTISCT